MSDYWAQRERATQALVRAIAGYVLKQRVVTSRQIYGLCKLTWITTDATGPGAPDIKSTKLPALGAIFGDWVDTSSLESTARDVASRVGEPRVYQLVMADTGFTHFYAAYRLSLEGWLEKFHESILPMVRMAYLLESDAQTIALARHVMGVKGIPKTNHPMQLMKPGRALTPLFFSLDPRHRFPVINGRKGIQKLLGSHGKRKAALHEQVHLMLGCIDGRRIKDAADLDAQVGFASDLKGLVRKSPALAAHGTPLEKKPTSGRNLPLKDEADQTVLMEALIQTRRKVHNRMTNRLLELLDRYQPKEGSEPLAMFDVMLDSYNKAGEPLLLEVKSSSEDAHVRMAIGQLLAYAHRVNPDAHIATAIVLPERPALHVRTLLQRLRIGCIWFESDQFKRLKTDDKTLKHLTLIHVSTKGP